MRYLKEYWEEQEEHTLAAYALKSKNATRLHAEPEPALYRTNYQRDWNRVLHSQSFRKLEFKTQVFPFGEGLDITRNRLTHSLEVLQIATSIANGLGANSDCVMAISLAHDLGHPPFGHTGEQALKEMTNDFNHNHHSLNIVMHLEKRYTDFNGLNLTMDVLEGLEKHITDYDRPVTRPFIIKGTKNPSLEGQIVDYSDTIAYRCHDLEDSLLSGIIDFSAFLKSPPGILKVIREIPVTREKTFYLCQLTRALINQYVQDIIDTTSKNIQHHKITSCNAIRKCPCRLVEFSHKLKELDKELGNYLFDNYYTDFRIARMMNKGKDIIKNLFNIFCRNERLMPKNEVEKIGPRNTKEKVIANYIASMTDREALKQYSSIFNH